MSHENLDAYKVAIDAARWIRVARFPHGDAALRDPARRAADRVVLPLALALVLVLDQDGTNLGGSDAIALGARVRGRLAQGPPRATQWMENSTPAATQVRPRRAAPIHPDRPRSSAWPARGVLSPTPVPGST